MQDKKHGIHQQCNIKIYMILTGIPIVTVLAIWYTVCVYHRRKGFERDFPFEET